MVVKTTMYTILKRIRHFRVSYIALEIALFDMNLIKTCIILPQVCHLVIYLDVLNYIFILETHIADKIGLKYQRQSDVLHYHTKGPQVSTTDNQCRVEGPVPVRLFCCILFLITLIIHVCQF